MKRFICFLFLVFCFSSYAHLCSKCQYVSCPGNIGATMISHLYICPNYANGQGHHVWSDETGIYPASCLTCGGLACPTHGVHSGGKPCPGSCPNLPDCNKQTCSVCSAVCCTVHAWHGSQEITFSCGLTLKKCFSSESDMNAWLSSLNRSCSIIACSKCMAPWCRNHGSHNCSSENNCPNGSDCSVTRCLTCDVSWCSAHGSHICNGSSGGNSGGTEGGGTEGGGTEGGGDSGAILDAIKSVKTAVDSTKPPLDQIKTSVDGVKTSVDGVKSSVDGVKDAVLGVPEQLKFPIKGVEDSVRSVDDTLRIIDYTIKDKGDDIVDKLKVSGTPNAPADFNFNKEQEKPSLDRGKIDRSVIDQISQKLFPPRINTPSGSGDLFLTFTIPCRSICSFVPDYKVELSSQSFWSNSAIVSAASFCKTVTYFFFGWVTLLAFARALRQW